MSSAPPRLGEESVEQVEAQGSAANNAASTGPFPARKRGKKRQLLQQKKVRPNQCQFIIPPPKSRRCNLTAAPGAQYCGVHAVGGAGTGSDVERVLCPFCGDRIRATRLQKHVRRCNEVKRARSSKPRSTDSRASGNDADTSSATASPVANKASIPADVVDLCSRRSQAKGRKDFAAADELRSQIWARGFIVEDVKKEATGPSGDRVITFDWVCKPAQNVQPATEPLKRRKGQNRSADSARRRRNRKVQQRNAAKKPRIAEFAAFLVAKFGLDVLRQGRGVLDVAGGKGKLAYHLAVERGIPATVVDPMPLRFSPHKTKDILKRALAWKLGTETDTAVCAQPPSTDAEASRSSNSVTISGGRDVDGMGQEQPPEVHERVEDAGEILASCVQSKKDTVPSAPSTAAPPSPQAVSRASRAAPRIQGTKCVVQDCCNPAKSG